MLSEHLIFSIAISIFLYTIYKRRECFYIIIGSAFVPDIDLALNIILRKFGLITIVPIWHGIFHNITSMIIYAIFISLIFTNINKNKAFLLGIIGFGAHLIEDIIVYTKAYKFLYPFSNEIQGLGIISNYKQHIDFFGIASTEVLIIGIIMIIFSVYIYLLSKKPIYH